MLTSAARSASSDNLLTVDMPASDAKSAPAGRRGRAVRALGGPAARGAAARRSLAAVRDQWQRARGACQRTRIEHRNVQARLLRADAAVVQRDAARARRIGDDAMVAALLSGSALTFLGGALFYIAATDDVDFVGPSAVDNAIGAGCFSVALAIGATASRHLLAASWHGFVAGTPEYREGLRGRADQIGADLRRLEASEYRQEMAAVATAVEDSGHLLSGVSGLIAGYAVEPPAREDDAGAVAVVVAAAPPAAAAARPGH